MSGYIGIDIGSTTCKAVLIDGDELKASVRLPAGNNYSVVAREARDRLLTDSGSREDDLRRVVSTGYGNGLIDFSDEHLDSVICCAAGLNYLLPAVRTIIDIQSQSIKIISVSDSGKVIDLVSSEKCAIGAGIFVEIVANVLQVDLDEIGPLSLKSTAPVTFSTGCAVFGESEAVSRVAEGIPKEDIIAGVHNAIAETILQLARRVDIRQPVAVCGGGALNAGLVKSLTDAGFDLETPKFPQLANAIGAAIIAKGGNNGNP